MLAPLSVSSTLKKSAPGGGAPGQRILELDGLRGLAILEVVCRHYGITESLARLRSPAAEFISHLCMRISGVDIFFVITGFLLGKGLLATLDSSSYYSTFYFRRFCRTFPPYYLFLFLASLAVLGQDFLCPDCELNLAWPFGSPWSMVAYASFLQSFWIASAASYGPRYIAMTWSLAVQEQFYLALPWILRHARGRCLVYVFGALFMVGPLSRLTVVCSLPPTRWGPFDCVICCQMDTLCIGVLTAWLLQTFLTKGRPDKVRWLLGFLAAALFGGFYLLAYFEYVNRVRSTELFVVRHSLMALLYAVLVLSIALGPVKILSAFLRSAVLRALGRISYGIYLSHQLIHILVCGAVLGTSPGFRKAVGLDAWLVPLFAFLISVFVGGLSWNLVEKPFTRWGKS